jgi:hypothetical protein
MRSESACGLYADASGDARHQNSFALKIDAGQHIVRGRGRTKYVCHVAVLLGGRNEMPTRILLTG